VDPRAIRRFVPALLVDAPDFRRLWFGQTISVVGDQVTQLGLPLVAVLTLGADASQMGLLTAVGLLPHLLFSLPAGVWLDRVRSRRRLMIAADLGRAALIGSIPLAYVLGGLSMPQLYIVGFVAGSLSVIFDLSWNTVFVSVTERTGTSKRWRSSTAVGRLPRSPARPSAVSWSRFHRAVGPAARRRLLPRFGLLPAPDPVTRTADRGRRDRPAQLLAGLSFVLRDPIMRPTLLSVATINLFTFTSSALFVLYATTILRRSRRGPGLALGTGAVGAVFGALVANRIGRRIGLGPAYALGCVIFPASLLLIPIAGPGMPMPLILALLFGSEFGAGFGVMILDINVGAILYARTPDRIRARAGGAFRFVNYGVRPIGALLGGILGGAIGVREAIAVGTILAIGGVLFLVGSPVLKLHDLPEESG
jgi:MFS family permease